MVKRKRRDTNKVEGKSEDPTVKESNHHANDGDDDDDDEADNDGDNERRDYPSSSSTATSPGGDPIIPIRQDISDLYAAPETIHCAFRSSCIPCTYKIGLFDVAQDIEFCQQIPNQRPEQCPRLKGTMMTITGRKQQQQRSGRTNTRRKDEAANIQRTSTAYKNSSLGYRPGMSVLCVGDGDFSFSLAIARILFSNNHDMGRTPTSTTRKPETTNFRSSRLIATSYETKETLERVYPNFQETLEELQKLGAIILYEVDATKLAKSLSGDPIRSLFMKSKKDSTSSSSSKKKKKNELSLLEGTLDRICWNFPCSAVEHGQDGQNDEMEHNKDLIRAFVSNAIGLLRIPNNVGCGGGEIHICHKTKPPYNQWKLEEVVAEGAKLTTNNRNKNVDHHHHRSLPKETTIESSSSSSSLSSPVLLLRYAGKIVLDRALILPYIPRKALDRKSFPCHDACIYVFERNVPTNHMMKMEQNDKMTTTITTTTQKIGNPSTKMEDDDNENCRTFPSTLGGRERQRDIYHHVTHHPHDDHDGTTIKEKGSMTTTTTIHEGFPQKVTKELIQSLRRFHLKQKEQEQQPERLFVQRKPQQQHPSSSSSSFSKKTMISSSSLGLQTDGRTGGWIPRDGRTGGWKKRKERR